MKTVRIPRVCCYSCSMTTMQLLSQTGAGVLAFFFTTMLVWELLAQ